MAKRRRHRNLHGSLGLSSTGVLALEVATVGAIGGVFYAIYRARKDQKAGAAAAAAPSPAVDALPPTI